MKIAIIGLPLSGKITLFTLLTVSETAGKALLEGKDYIIEDGEICNFRFKV